MRKIDAQLRKAIGCKKLFFHFVQIANMQHKQPANTFGNLVKSKFCQENDITTESLRQNRTTENLSISLDPSLGGGGG